MNTREGLIQLIAILRGYSTNKLEIRALDCLSIELQKNIDNEKPIGEMDSVEIIEDRWVCPVCGCRNSLDVLKCLREDCNFRLSRKQKNEINVRASNATG